MKLVNDFFEYKILAMNDKNKIEVENIIYKYKSCDYRDKDIYEPTTKIIRILDKYFNQ